jgi:hypothetical protein
MNGLISKYYLMAGENPRADAQRKNNWLINVM